MRRSNLVFAMIGRTGKSEGDRDNEDIYSGKKIMKEGSAKFRECQEVLGVARIEDYNIKGVNCWDVDQQSAEC